MSALFKTLAVVFALAFVAGCSTSSEPVVVDQGAINQLKIKNLSHPGKLIYASGQPTRDEFRGLAQAGIKHVINLRPAQEQEWNEAEFVQSLGMEYHSLPVAGAAGITTENAASLAEMIAAVNGEPVLVHCSSSNRVGALIALVERMRGVRVDEAIATGKEWGLTRLESVVREISVTP